MEPLFERVFPGARKATKRRVLNCALDAFDQGGTEGLTIEAIRERSGASIGSIYHHFGNKEGIAAAIFLAALDDQQERFEEALQQAKGVPEAVQGWVQAYIAWVVEHPRLARFLFGSRRMLGSPEAAQALKARNERRYGPFQAQLAQARADGLVRVLPPEMYLPLLIGPAENYCRAWLSARVKSCPSTHSALFAEAAWRAIAVESD